MSPLLISPFELRFRLTSEILDIVLCSVFFKLDFFKVYGTMVLSMAPCYDKIYRLTSLYSCMLGMCIVSVPFAVASGVLMSDGLAADLSSLDDWFVFRTVIVLSLFYLVAHAMSAALLPLFLVTEYVPLGQGSVPLWMILSSSSSCPNMKCIYKIFDMK